MNIADLITEFGAFYQNGGQGVKDLNKQIMVMAETEKAMFTVIPTEDTVLRKANASIGKVLQKFQKGFTASGDVAFVPRQIDLTHIKIDYREYPADLEASWIGFLATKGLAAKDAPLISYVINNLIIGQAAEDFELDAIYGGTDSSVTPGTAKLIANGFKGIKKVINDHITATDTTAITMGALPTDAVEFVNYVEDFAKQIPKHIRRICKPIAMSDENYDLFVAGNGMKYNQGWNQQSALEAVRNTGMSVVGLASMTGSDKIWTTIEGNAVMGFKKSSNENVFQIQEDKREVLVMTDFWKGLGFWMPEHIYTNDVELS